ncbi:MAG: FAD-dependent oxidoreductase [Armatimonadetes bacterium]|nr:FAD-dependent oxidoreductase [Armatimonadota bacterium]
MQTLSPEVVVFQGTPAGIAAAIAAARMGARVVLVHSGARLGGMLTNGICASDLATLTAVGGLFREFTQRVRHFYVSTYAPQSPQVELCAGGFNYEPGVAQKVLDDMVAAEPLVVLRRQRLLKVQKSRDRVTGIVVEDEETGKETELLAGAFVDASYEGDLAARAGAPYRVGREGRATTSEPYAGVIYMHPITKRVYPASTGEGDRRVQAYNYRLCMTTQPDLRVPPVRPVTYDRRDYLPILDDLSRGIIDRFAGLGTQPGVVSYLRLPNGKADVNNNPYCSVSTDLPEENAVWPEGDAAARAAFARRLKDYTLGLLWFCQNDPDLPESFRAEAREWGLARDEYADSDNFPRQVYVREARRILGEYVFTAHDCVPAPGQERPPLHADSVTAAHYTIDSHATRKREPDQPVAEGFLSLRPLTAVYQVPFRVMVPQQVDGLLVPVACSATHLGFCSLRVEPCWMALGQAAGIAAHMMEREGASPRDFPVERLQRRLIRQGAVLTWFEDLDATAAVFPGVQFFGTRGFFPTYRARAEEPVTRAQAAIWLAQVAPAQADVAGAPPYGDVGPDHPAAAAVAALRARGVFAGDEPPNEFRPGEWLTWMELDRWLHQALGARLESLSVKPTARPYVLRGEFCQALFEVGGGAG